MLRLALIFLAVMVVAGVLGFVVDVAGGVAKVLFFVCLIGLAVSLIMRALGRRG